MFIYLSYGFRLYIYTLFIGVDMGLGVYLESILSYVKDKSAIADKVYSKEILFADYPPPLSRNKLYFSNINIYLALYHQ